MESVQLWAITAYELLLWVRTSALLRWCSALPFLHWQPSLDNEWHLLATGEHMNHFIITHPLPVLDLLYVLLSVVLWYVYISFLVKKWKGDVLNFQITGNIVQTILAVQVTTCLEIIVESSWLHYFKRTNIAWFHRQWWQLYITSSVLITCLLLFSFIWSFIHKTYISMMLACILSPFVPIEFSADGTFISPHRCCTLQGVPGGIYTCVTVCFTDLNLFWKQVSKNILWGGIFRQKKAHTDILARSNFFPLFSWANCGVVDFDLVHL